MTVGQIGDVGPGSAWGLSLRRCRLCPRRCGVDRLRGEHGYCGAGSRVRIYRYGAHGGEEPPVSGIRGSGTIFFSRCTLKCIYCQNYPWSQGEAGREYDAEALIRIMREVAEQGCHNWNLVSPTPWLPQIADAVDNLQRAGIALPIVYNTSGFENVETIEALGRRIAVYLTDLRYATAGSAAEGSGAPQYVEVARQAIRAMRRAVGEFRVSAGGMAVSGVICRVLILPGRPEEAVESLRWLAAEFGTDVAVSVMAQYTPLHWAVERPPWNRVVSRSEYDQVCAVMEDLGFTTGWIQEYGQPVPDGLLGARMAPVEQGG